MKRRTGTRVAAGLLTALLLVSVLAGCAGEEAAVDEVGRAVGGSEPMAATDAGVSEEYAESDKAVQTTSAEGTTAETDRLIIRTQTMRVEVESTPDAVESLRGLAKTNGAVITDLQVATDTDEWLYRYDEYGYSVGDGAALRGWMTVRVPAESLDAFVTGAMALGSVKYQAEDTQDVTEQHVDLTARLANLQAQEVRLRTFFDAAQNVTDMLAIEAELNRVRQEIESMQAQVTYLERQAAMATVTIELTEEQAVVRPDGEDWGLEDAVTDGIQGAAGVLGFVIRLVLATLPLWVPALIILFVVWMIVKRRRAKRLAEATASAEVAYSAPNDQTGE
ncbi:MAG: DUF4349 domain-containing protein [Coriobacteriia bacterium]|nr:DUF4349 domain-containing protein [Coriobacteriia bacterium]